MWTDPFDFQRQLAAAGHGQRNPVCFLIILQQDLSQIQYLLDLGIFKVIFSHRVPNGPYQHSPHFSIFNTALHAISTKQTKEVNICISRPFFVFCLTPKPKHFQLKGMTTMHEALFHPPIDILIMLLSSQIANFEEQPTNQSIPRHTQCFTFGGTCSFHSFLHILLSLHAEESSPCVEELVILTANLGSIRDSFILLKLKTFW